MKVLVTTIPSARHMWDIVPVAWALRSAGHDVRVAALPNVTARLRETGLTAFPVGPVLDPRLLPDGADYDEDSLVPWVRRVAQGAGLLAHGLFGTLNRFRPDLVLYERMDLAGPLIAQYLGIPAVHLRYGPPYPQRWSAALDKGASGLRRRFGLDDRVVPPALVIDVWPPSLQDTANWLPAPHQSMRFASYGGPVVVPQWLLEPPSRPRVCVTMGTATPGEGMLLRARIINLISGLGLGAEIIVPPVPANGGEVPSADGVRVVDWLPLPLLLASGCALVVHHGGPGSTLSALSYGVPQLVLIVHSHSDWRVHAMNARLVDSCGAGRSLTRVRKPEEELADAVRALLTDPGYGRAARRVAVEMASQPSPADVVGVLEDLVEGWRPAGMAASDRPVPA